MPITKLTDVVVPKTFAEIVVAKLTESSPIRQSGIAVTDPKFQVSKGFETTVPFWRRPAGGEAQSQTGNEADRGSAQKVTQGNMTARVLSRANAFSAMAISSYATGAEAIDFASGEFARLRVSDEESAILSILKGIEGANSANRIVTADGVAVMGKANDMIVSRSITTGTINAANKFSKDVLLAGRASMGDKGSELKTLILHSDVVNGLRALEPNAFIPASQTDIGLERYMGYNIIETDNAPVDTTNASYPIYTSYMLGGALFGYAEGVQDRPLEDVRDAQAGQWSGQDTIVNRFRYMLHAYGYMNSGNPANGVSLTNAELAVATNWTRAVERKAVPLSILKTNG